MRRTTRSLPRIVKTTTSHVTAGRGNGYVYGTRALDLPIRARRQPRCSGRAADGDGARARARGLVDTIEPVREHGPKLHLARLPRREGLDAKRVELREETDVRDRRRV